MFHLLQRRSWCAQTCWSPLRARCAPPAWSGWPPVPKISCFSLSSSLSQGHCCRHRQDIHLVFSMTSVKSCISKLGCRNDQAVWNTKKWQMQMQVGKNVNTESLKNEYWSWLRWWLERTIKSNNGGDLCTSVQKISRVFGMTLRRCYLRIGGRGVGNEDWE